MEPGDELPEHSSALRAAKKLHMMTDPPTLAFMLDAGEAELSLQWLEYFADVPNDKERLKRACHELRAKPNRSGFILRVPVDDARNGLNERSDFAGVRFVWTPANPDGSHSSIARLNVLSEALQQSAALAIARTVRNRFEWRKLEKRGLAPRQR